MKEFLTKIDVNKYFSQVNNKAILVGRPNTLRFNHYGAIFPVILKKKKLIIVLSILLSCFISTIIKAQTKNVAENTTQLIDQINTLMPYRTAVQTIDYQSIPTALSINADNYVGLYNYSNYLKKSIDNRVFIKFTENCLNHLSSKNIKNPEDIREFREELEGEEPFTYD